WCEFGTPTFWRPFREAVFPTEITDGACIYWRKPEQWNSGRILTTCVGSEHFWPLRYPSMNPYSSLCDDFGVYVYLNTKMELPSNRETVLHFFESLRKQFPEMTDFDCRENGEFVLEEDREQGSYRWVTLETRRIGSGYVNPPTLETVDEQHQHVLELAPYHLDFSTLDCEALDVLFAF